MLRATIAGNLRIAVGHLLVALDIPEGIVNRELMEMQPVVIAPATNRRAPKVAMAFRGKSPASCS